MRDLHKDLELVRGLAGDFAHAKIAKHALERAIEVESKLAALTEMHEKFADNAEAEYFALLERAKKAEATIAESESWTDAVCNKNDALSMLNKELADALAKWQGLASVGLLCSKCVSNIDDCNKRCDIRKAFVGGRQTLAKEDTK